MRNAVARGIDCSTGLFNYDGERALGSFRQVAVAHICDSDETTTYSDTSSVCFCGLPPRCSTFPTAIQGFHECH